MRAVLARTLLAGLFIQSAGCAHHQVGRPPNAAEIMEINESGAADPGAFRPVYVRPISDGEPSSIRRIIGADQRQLSVVSDSGDVRQLDLSTIAGVTTRSRKLAKGALAGGGFGLLAGGVAVVAISASSASWPDAPVTAEPAHPASKATLIGTAVTFTLVGAILGMIVEDRSPTVETFDFGGGHGLFTPAAQR